MWVRKEVRVGMLDRVLSAIERDPVKVPVTRGTLLPLFVLSLPPRASEGIAAQLRVLAHAPGAARIPLDELMDVAVGRISERPSPGSWAAAVAQARLVVSQPPLSDQVLRTAASLYMARPTGRQAFGQLAASLPGVSPVAGAFRELREWRHLTWPQRVGSVAAATAAVGVAGLFLAGLPVAGPALLGVVGAGGVSLAAVNPLTALLASGLPSIVSTGVGTSSALMAPTALRGIVGAATGSAWSAPGLRGAAEQLIRKYAGGVTREVPSSPLAAQHLAALHAIHDTLATAELTPPERQQLAATIRTHRDMLVQLTRQGRTFGQGPEVA